VPEKMFSREQYEQLRSFPEISRDELFRYFRLTPAEVAFVDPGAGRGPADRLGMAVQLTTLPWLGFVPGDVASAGQSQVSCWPHISPGHSDNINFFGGINVDIEAELAKLTGGWRPLRLAHFRDLGL
jgi:hypothetical protein